MAQENSWRCTLTEEQERPSYADPHRFVTLTMRCSRLANHDGECDFDPPYDPHGPDGFPV